MEKLLTSPLRPVTKGIMLVIFCMKLRAELLISGAGAGGYAIQFCAVLFSAVSLRMQSRLLLPFSLVFI